MQQILSNNVKNILATIWPVFKLMTLSLTCLSKTDILLVNDRNKHMFQHCTCLHAPCFHGKPIHLKFQTRELPTLALFIQNLTLCQLATLFLKSFSCIFLCFLQDLSGLPCRLSWDALLLTLSHAKAEKVSEWVNDSWPAWKFLPSKQKVQIM